MRTFFTSMSRGYLRRGRRFRVVGELQALGHGPTL